MNAIDYRAATPSDLRSIARIHTENWQEGYRGAFSDAFLDSELPGSHVNEWQEKLTSPRPHQYTECAVENDQVIGFICGFGALDAEWGSFIDNLHVASAARGRGIGATLMQRYARWLDARFPELPIFLFALHGNTAAQRFYERIGGADAGIITEELHGNVVRSHRYIWHRPRELLLPHR